MSPHTITSFDLYKIRLPMGRVIGDCGCAYDEMSVAVLALHTADGLTGWGFGETPRGGTGVSIVVGYLASLFFSPPTTATPNNTALLTTSGDPL